jgi:hypothetical protein
MADAELPDDGITSEEGANAVPSGKPLTKTSRSIRDDEEAMRAIAEADENSQRAIQFPVIPQEGGDPDDALIPNDTQDPKRARTLYYKHVMRMLRKYLKGVPKPANAAIRKEIRLFLNEGHTSGRDVRQTYYHLYEVAIATILAWVKQYGGNNLQALFIAFRELNDARDARNSTPTGDATPNS